MDDIFEAIIELLLETKYGILIIVAFVLILIIVAIIIATIGT